MVGMADAEPVTTQRSTVEDWTRALSESAGSPGGGAGAGVMLAIAASLTSMVAGYTEPEDGRRTELDQIHARARSLREEALQLADEDASASKSFGAAFRLDPGSEREEAVRRASGRNFAVQYAPRRDGDIVTMVADTSRIRATLDWTPRYDDLETIARHALAWEEKLVQERHGLEILAKSA